VIEYFPIISFLVLC